MLAQPRLRRPRRPSLRTKIIIWSVIPTAIILTIVGGVTLHSNQRVTEDLLIQRDQELTHLIAYGLAQELTEDVEILALLARPAHTRDTAAQSYVYSQVSSIIKPRLGRGGRAYLVDNSGRIIFHSDLTRIGTDVSEQPVVQRVLDGQTGTLRTNDVNGQSVAASYAPVPGTNWGLITEESWIALTRSTEAYRRSLFILLVLGTMMPILIITIGVRRITRPIAELVDATQKVASGDFDHTIAISTGDELEGLAEHFNRMTTHIQASHTTLERRVSDRTKELATLYAIAANINASSDLDQTLNQALDELLNLLDMEVGEIRLLDQSENGLVIHTQRGLSDAFVHASNGLGLEETLPGQALIAGQPVFHEDAQSQPGHTWARTEGLRAIAICPLQTQKRCLGTLGLATRRGPRAFNKSERELLRAASDQIGVAIEKAVLFEIEQRRAEQFQLINQVGQRIASILAVDQLLEEIVSLVSDTLSYYLVSIGLLEDSELVVTAIAGRAEDIESFRPVRLQVGRHGIMSQVALSGEPLLARDVSQETHYFHSPETNETRSELAVPIKSKDATIGVLDVQSERLNAFDENDLTVLQSLAHQAAIAIENARLYQKAQELAVMKERNRLARDLHDSVTQSLYGVTLFGEAAGRLMSSGNINLAAEHLQELQYTAREALREMRLLIFELRPPILGESGLAAALQTRLDAVEGRAGLEATFVTEGESIPLLPEIQEGLYRIAQETLNNALRHAQARHIKVCLRHSHPQVVLEISDDGIGFDPELARQQGGLGLQGMEERASELGAKLSIHSQPGEGTQVRVEVCQ